MFRVKTIFRAFYDAGQNILVHDGIEQGGYLAFVALLSLFPFLVFITALTGFFGAKEAGTEFINFVFAHLPPDMINSLAPRVNEIISGPPQGLLTVSIIGAIWTSSSQLEGYRTVLNRAYNVNATSPYLLRRLLSLVQTLILSFCLLLIVLSLVAIPVILEKITFLHDSIDTMDLSGQIAWLSVPAIFAAVFSAYYYLPNIKQTWHSVAPGAVMVTALLVIGTRVVSIYISQFAQVNVVYGSLGGVIATLLFFYIGNIIFIYGAEFNYALTGVPMEKQQIA